METRLEGGTVEQAAPKASLVDWIQEDVPDHLDTWPYTMGVIPLVLFGILAVTGILMTFYYIPHPDRAYESVWNITHGVYLGWFIRGMHKFAVDFMVLFLLLHMLRVFVTRGYRTPGEAKWVLGALLFVATLAMGFTGYALVYDNVSYWGTVVVANMIGAVPLIGKPLLALLLGGEEISEITLLRLYDLHTKFLPVLLVLFIGGHIAAVRVLGLAKVEGCSGVHPFYPDHALKAGAMALGLLVLLVNLVLIFPPSLGPAANTAEVAWDIAPPWYFSAVFKWITIVPRQVGLAGIMAFLGLLFAYPYLDRFLSRKGWRMARVNLGVGAAAVIVFVLLTLWEEMG